MTDELKKIVSKLYHPIANKRQVFAMSRGSAEKLPLVPNVAAISITAPEKSLANLVQFEHLLRLSFADVDFKDKDLSKRAKEKLNNSFQASQAQEIINFVESLPAEIHSVVIHCEGGFSRSCAVAKFLHQEYGYVAQLEKLVNANPSVLQLLMDTKKKPISKRI